MNKIQNTTQKAAAPVIFIMTKAFIDVIVRVVMIFSAMFGFALWIKRMMTRVLRTGQLK